MFTFTHYVMGIISVHLQKLGGRGAYELIKKAPYFLNFVMFLGFLGFFYVLRIANLVLAVLKYHWLLIPAFMTKVKTLQTVTYL